MSAPAADDDRIDAMPIPEAGREAIRRLVRAGKLRPDGRGGFVSGWHAPLGRGKFRPTALDDRPAT